jgi:hypothetical protein
MSFDVIERSSIRKYVEDDERFTSRELLTGQDSVQIARI